eukprot:3972460-Amphidinium_carterae.1
MVLAPCALSCLADHGLAEWRDNFDIACRAVGLQVNAAGSQWQPCVSYHWHRKVSARRAVSKPCKQLQTKPQQSSSY